MKNSDITIMVITLNDMHRDLDNFFLSLINNNPAEIIVVDGGSKDGTIETAKKYTKSVYVTNPGMSKQHQFALNLVKTKYVYSTSTNKHATIGLLKNLKIEFENNDCFSMQAKTKCKFESNFFEKGTKVLYELLQNNDKYIDVPTGPSLFNAKKYLELVNKLVLSPASQTYSIDTVRASLIKKQNLKYLYSKHYAIFSEKLNFKTYVKKITSYGTGDYFYYLENKNHWSFYRKFLSLTHVFRRYVINFPLRCILKPRFYGAIPFFWFTAALRYYGFFKSFSKK